MTLQVLKELDSKVRSLHDHCEKNDAITATTSETVTKLSERSEIRFCKSYSVQLTWLYRLESVSSNVMAISERTHGQEAMEPQLKGLEEKIAAR